MKVCTKHFETINNPYNQCPECAIDLLRREVQDLTMRLVALEMERINRGDEKLLDNDSPMW